MRRRDVLQHFGSVLKEERGYLIANQERLLSASFGFFETWSIINTLDNSRKPSSDFVTELETPRISHNLYSNLVYELGSSRGARLAQAIGLIGGTLLPLSGATINPPTASAALTGVSKDRCKDAERYFRDSLTQARTGRFANQRELHVYYDVQGRPLAVQKTREVRTSLVLQDMAIVVSGNNKVKDEGVTHIPAGTLVSVDETQRGGQAVKRSRSGI